jgi:urease accessory protein UreF
MDATELLRVVALKKGKLKSGEFRLRGGERGLSLFARVKEPSPQEVLDAVRSAGKQGELAVAVIAATAVRELGLSIVATRGGTPSEAVNAIHCYGSRQ